MRSGKNEGRQNCSARFTLTIRLSASFDTKLAITKTAATGRNYLQRKSIKPHKRFSAARNGSVWPKVSTWLWRRCSERSRTGNAAFGGSMDKEHPRRRGHLTPREKRKIRRLNLAGK